jgi:Ankyrin repeat
MFAAYKDAAVAEALLKAGALLEDSDEGRTALWYAACAANRRVVAVLLGAGAKQPRRERYDPQMRRPSRRRPAGTVNTA